MTESLRRILMLIELWFIIDTIVSAFEVLNYLIFTNITWDKGYYNAYFIVTR